MFALYITAKKNIFRIFIVLLFISLNIFLINKKTFADSSSGEYTTPGATPNTKSVTSAEIPTKNSASHNLIDKASFARAIEEEAERRGISLGWRKEASSINKTLKENSSYLDTIFDFRPFMLSDHILAPAIGSSSDDFTVESFITAKSFEKQYRFISPAKTVSIPPDWRSYLLLTMYPEHKVNTALLPKDSEEKEMWKEGIKKGWKHGVELADEEELINLRTLKRDIIGRIRYYRMLKDHILAPPSWTTTNLGVLSDKDNQIVTIGAKALQITNESRFMAPKNWIPEYYTSRKTKKQLEKTNSNLSENANVDSTNNDDKTDGE